MRPRSETKSEIWVGGRTWVFTQVGLGSAAPFPGGYLRLMMSRGVLLELRRGPKLREEALVAWSHIYNKVVFRLSLFLWVVLSSFGFFRGSCRCWSTGQRLSVLSSHTAYYSCLKHTAACTHFHFHYSSVSLEEALYVWNWKKKENGRANASVLAISATLTSQKYKRDMVMSLFMTQNHKDIKMEALTSTQTESFSKFVTGTFRRVFWLMADHVKIWDLHHILWFPMLG